MGTLVEKKVGEGSWVVDELLGFGCELEDLGKVRLS